MARIPRPPPLSDHMMDPGARERAKDPVRAENFDWILSEAPAKPLAAVVRKLINAQNGRLTQNARFASLYCNEDLLRPNILTASPGRGERPEMPRQTLNLVKVYSDTLAGKLVQSNSRVTAVTVQGDWKTYRLARKLDRILDTTFMQGRLFREASKVVVDALTVGIGYLYVGEEDGKVTYERWYYNELFVDQLDAMYGRPTMLFRIRYMYPENALAIWGKSEEAAESIRKAPRANPPAFAWTPYEAGMIEIFEAWALDLPNRPGRHVLCTAAGVIKEGKYTKDKFPVVPFRASELPLGWYGQGFVAHSGPTQVWLNLVLDIMSRSAKLGLAPFWVVSGGADISLKQINNVPGHIVTSNGPAPEWVTNVPFHPNAIEYAQFMKAQLGIIYGVSDVEAAGEQAGNRQDSNPALIQMQDMWMARHTILLKNWSEEFYLDVAERTVEVAQDIARRRDSYPVVATARGRAWAMDWKDFLELEKESYRLQLGTESALPLSPAARKRMILDWANAGLLPADQAQQLMLGGADIDSVASQFAAFENNADWVCEQLMDGEVPDLDELQKLDLLYQRVRVAALNAHEFGAPPGIILNFHTYASRVQAELQKTQAALMPPMGGMNVPGNPAPAGPAPAAPI